jgi:hypothetical protein
MLQPIGFNYKRRDDGGLFNLTNVCLLIPGFV